jgi:hypothetical protein
MTRRLVAAWLLIALALWLPAVATRIAAGKDRGRDQRQQSRTNAKSSRRDSSDSKDSKSAKSDKKKGDKDDQDDAISDSPEEAWINDVPQSKRKDARRELQRRRDGRDRDLAAAAVEKDPVRREQRKSAVASAFQSDLDKLKVKYLPARRTANGNNRRSGGDLTDDQRRIAELAERKLQRSDRDR